MEERMKILKLLEEGKITADEAVKLLEAIKEGEPIHKNIIREAGETVSSAISSVVDILKSVSSIVVEKIKKEAEKIKSKEKNE